MPSHRVPRPVERWSSSWANGIYLLALEVIGFMLIRHGITVDEPAVVVAAVVIVVSASVGFRSWLWLQRH